MTPLDLACEVLKRAEAWDALHARRLVYWGAPEPMSDTEQEAHLDDIKRMFKLAERTGFEPKIETVTLARALIEAEKRADTLLIALNQLAAWDEGPVVTSGFCDPHTADIARKAIEQDKKRLT